jgi:RND family efflux transporter MFP subunit
MSGRDAGAVLDRLSVLYSVGAAGGLTDGELLEQFLRHPDALGEAAFAILVERHGPMVLRVCRGVLRDEHEAEDALQATFLVLARRARGIHKRGSVASWLFGVAVRVASRARTAASRRRDLQRRGAAMARQPATAGEPPELLPELHEEVDRLPEKYRAPIVLCGLEGLTHEQAAQRLGVPVGTVKVRFARAKERLRGRLLRRGLAPSLAALAGALSSGANAAIPASLAQSTARHAMQFATARAAAGATSLTVAALAQGVLRAMFLTRLKAAALAVTTLALALAAAWGLTPAPVVRAGPAQAQADEPTPPPSTGKPSGPGPFVLEAVKRMDLTKKTTQQGDVRPVREIDLYSRVSGYVAEAKMELGDQVKAGQILARIESPDAVAELERNEALLLQAQADVKRTQAALRVAHAGILASKAGRQAASAALEKTAANAAYRARSLVRMKDLGQRAAIEQKLVDEAEDQAQSAASAREAAKADLETAAAGVLESEAKLEQAAAEVEQANASVQVVQACVKKARALLDSATIHCPFDGTISAISCHVGDFVRSPSQGSATPLCTVIKMDAVRILVQLPVREAALLKRGAPVIVWIVEREQARPFDAELGRIAPTIVPVAGTRLAEVLMPNKEETLRAGQTALVEIALDVVRKALTIPDSAVRSDQGKPYCFRVVHGRLNRTPIRLGIQDGGRFQVLEGLEEGDAIVASPGPNLKDGQPVESAVGK